MTIKRILDSLSNIEGNPYAVADKSLKIIWYNKSFKNYFRTKRINGVSILKLFNLSLAEEILPAKKKTRAIPFPDEKFILKTTRLLFNYKTDGYLLYIEKEADAQLEQADQKEQTVKNQQFAGELRQILTLMAKEKSLLNLAEEILIRCTEIDNSKFGILLLNAENKKYEYIFYDPQEKLVNKEEIKREIESNFSFIYKWLNVNKRSLIIKNKHENLGYSLSKALDTEAALITPCFFEDNLLASVIIGKEEGFAETSEISNTEQFAALLAFAINSIRTRELNDALEARLLQAQKLETIGKLSSGMAHDFSNLLSSIFGSLNLLKKRVPEREDIYRLLDNIENSSIRAKDLTKGLLSFGKPTPKRKELIKPNLLLSEIEKVITQTFPLNIGFEYEVDENLNNILGNGTEIYQVLLNLCVNAKESIEGRGKITLISKNRTINESNIINYPLLAKGNYVWFSVIDTGSGIKEEYLSRIFDPYFSTKDRQTGSGSGLGLYVTYGIIKAHNGHIDVSSVPGKGTTFDVFIPAYEPTAAKKIIPAEKIILLADDEIMLRDLLAELLESYGYNVIKVSTGTEVLKVLIEEIKVDLVIIDYNMPGMNGLDCIRQIRGLEFKLPIILSSGSLSLQSNFDFKSMGISDLLNKPYEFETMLETIQRLI